MSSDYLPTIESLIGCHQTPFQDVATYVFFALLGGINSLTEGHTINHPHTPQRCKGCHIHTYIATLLIKERWQPMADSMKARLPRALPSPAELRQRARRRRVAIGTMATKKRN